MTDTRATLTAIGQLPDVEIEIADAALQLALADEPDADLAAARAHLSALARDAVAAAHPLPDDADQRVAMLRGLFRRHGYRPDDTVDFDDLAHANLVQVIARRRGLPVALGILWLHCATAAGWQAHGIDFPGYFLVGLQAQGTQAVVDVFAGGNQLDARDLRRLIKQVEGAAAELRPGLLQPMSRRAVLLRLQNNIKSRRLHNGDLRGGLECAETMLLIDPDNAALWREAALLNKGLDRVAAALRCFEAFLALVPQGEAATRARAAMDDLRTRLN
jgi:regulator of sirC expression with transglutaminase-like and TPR domain